MNMIFQNYMLVLIHNLFSLNLELSHVMQLLHF